MIPEGEDIYDRCLTQAEIQGNVNKVNGEQSCGFPPGGSPELIGGTPGRRGQPAQGGGHSRKELSAQASFRPGGEQSWVCVSKKKLKSSLCRLQL